MAASLVLMACLCKAARPAGFLPRIGETVRYRYLDSVQTPTGIKSEAATVTLKAIADNDIQVTIAIDRKGSHSLDFYVDQTGTLQPVSLERASSAFVAKRKGEDPDQQRDAAQSLFLRLGLASRLASHPGLRSFPIQLIVPWASGPCDPILALQSAGPDAFAGDASDTTIINPPQKKRRLSMLVALGLGLAGAFSDSATGHYVSAAGVVASTTGVERTPSDPLPADVKLHLDGHFEGGRLAVLSGDQETLVHAGKRERTITDKWSLIAS